MTKLVVDPKIKDVQFITKISQAYDGAPNALMSCIELTSPERFICIPLSGKGLSGPMA
jgi:hypothetical protein